MKNNEKCIYCGAPVVAYKQVCWEHLQGKSKNPQKDISTNKCR